MSEKLNTNPESEQTTTTSWDTLGQQVPFQAAVEETPDRKQPKTVGEWYREWGIQEVDLNSEAFNQRFEEAAICEDTTEYIAKPVTKIQFIVDPEQGGPSGITVDGWLGGSTAESISPSVKIYLEKFKIASAEQLYNLSGDDTYGGYTISPEELAQQYTQNQNGTYHNPELLRIIKATPEEMFTIDRESLQEADASALDGDGPAQALHFTEYYTAPVDPANPDLIPTTGRRAVPTIRSGYKPIQQ